MPKWTTSPQTPETLAATADEIGQLAAAIRVVGESMKLYGIATLNVTHADSRKRGLELLESFSGAARSALREAREVRGDFGVEGVSDVSESGPKSPKTSNKLTKNGTHRDTKNGKHRGANG